MREEKMLNVLEITDHMATYNNPYAGRLIVMQDDYGERYEWMCYTAVTPLSVGDYKMIRYTVKSNKLGIKQIFRCKKVS